MNTVQMRRLETIGWIILFVSLFLIAFSGCGTILDQLNPPVTRVELFNDGQFPVDVVIYISDEQEIPRDLLTETGTRLEYTLQPGEREVIVRDCDDLQALVVDDADLRVVGGIGPETDTDVLRDGDEFTCRSTLVLTFTHTDVLVDFHIESRLE